MADILSKIRKAIEESLENARANAQGLKEIAEDYGKTARLKFELHQLKLNERKKFELLGKTVFPFLITNDYTGLKKHETLRVILDDLKNVQNEIQLTQNELEQHLSKGEDKSEEKPKQKVQEEIKQIESEIEARLEEIKKIRESAKAQAKTRKTKTTKKRRTRRVKKED